MINKNVIAEIKAEDEEFGIHSTDFSIARDYFNRMSPLEKGEVITMVGKHKNALELSRACISKVQELIAECV